jgi:hypothetical protein
MAVGTYAGIPDIGSLHSLDFLAHVVTRRRFQALLPSGTLQSLKVTQFPQPCLWSAIPPDVGTAPLRPRRAQPLSAITSDSLAEAFDRRPWDLDTAFPVAAKVFASLV